MARKNKSLSPQKQQKIDTMMRSAVAAHQAGDLVTAERVYRKVLKEAPDFSEALHFLGLARFQHNDADAGARYINQAIAQDRSNPLFYYNLGNVQKARGKLELASHAYVQALELNPDYYQAAANLGGIYDELGLLDKAIEQYNSALHINPRDAISCNNLGTVYRKRYNDQQAEHFYRQAVALQPQYAEAWSNLGLLLRDRGDLTEAEQVCHKAVELNPHVPELWVNLGSVLAKPWRLQAANDCYQRALALAPDNAASLAAYASVLREQGDIDGAIDRLLQSKAREQFNSAYWDCLLYTFNFSYSSSSSKMLEYALEYDNALQGYLKKLGIKPAKHSDLVISKARLKIGFVSPDFCVHSCAYFLLPLFENLNRDRFEIYCYSNVENPDKVTARFQELADRWYDAVGQADQELATIINNDDIDILVDLAGHTRGNRLTVFAMRPAPVQVTWLGYPNTTGLRSINYRITDVVADPGDCDDYYSEKLFRLSHGFLCFQSITQMPDVSSLPALENGYITFGCMNNFAKVTNEVLDLWAKLLQQIPDSRLLLKAKQLADKDNQARVIAYFKNHDIEAERLTLYGQLPSRDDHFAQYHHIDIALDPFPYNGTTTTCEALWMGVPVVCLNGDRHAGRVGASLLTHTGLTQFIAADADHYLTIAKELTSDLDKLAQLRCSLRNTLQASDLCNAKQFTRDMEAAFQAMWNAMQPS
jgi:protein O-GlcNAc transferase